MSMRLMTSLAVVVLISGAASKGAGGQQEPQKFQGKVRWSYDAGETVVGQLTVKGQICLAAVLGKHFEAIPGNGQGKVIALDKDSGKLLWEFKIQSKQPGQYVTWKDSVIFGSDEGVLYALDLSSGTVRWKTEIKGHLGGYAGIAITRDCVAIVALAQEVVDETGPLYLVDCEKGKILWKKDGHFKAVATDERFIYLGSPDRLKPTKTPAMVTACLPKDGKEVWTFDSHKGFMTQFQSFALDSEHLYTASYTDGGSTQYLYALKKVDGTIAWKVPLRKNGVRKGPHLLADKVYVTDWSGKSTSMNAKTGEVVAAIGKNSDQCFPIADGVILEWVAAYDIKTGTRLWNANPLPKAKPKQNSEMATPTVDQGKIYTDLMGHVICIE